MNVMIITRTITVATDGRICYFKLCIVACFTLVLFLNVIYFIVANIEWGRSDFDVYRDMVCVCVCVLVRFHTITRDEGVCCFSSTVQNYAVRSLP